MIWLPPIVIRRLEMVFLREIFSFGAKQSKTKCTMVKHMKNCIDPQKGTGHRLWGTHRGP